MYQFVGAAGLAAHARHPVKGHSSDAQRLDVQTRRGTVIHEQDDMDVVVRLSGGSDAAGIQFKFSGEFPPLRIERNELIDILDAFHRSSLASRDCRFVEYVLISNRSFADAAQLLYETRGQASPDPRSLPRSNGARRS